jgi:hypothetical protein
MKEATLYVLTALVTGLHNLYELMNVVNGAPVDPLNCSALVGSATLLAAAVLVRFQPRTAARVGLGGSLLSWVFYAPLIFVSCLMPHTTWTELREFVLFREYIPLAGMVIGAVLLVVCTVNLGRAVMRTAKTDTDERTSGRVTP